MTANRERMLGTDAGLAPTVGPIRADRAPRGEAPRGRYEPPRILGKRSVERVTLLSGTIDPGPGGPPIGGE